MEVDGQQEGASGSTNDLSTCNINLQEGDPALPTVEIGSENWHSQVPPVTRIFLLFSQ